jgi:hypothetical protein
MSNDVFVEVKQGQININSVSLIRNTQIAKLIYIDTKSKYSEVTYGYNKNTLSIIAFKGEYTLYTNENYDHATEIELTFNDINFQDWQNQGWSVTLDYGRYSIIVSLIKESKSHRVDQVLWWREDDEDTT